MSISDITAEGLVWTEKIQGYHPAWLFFTLFVLLGCFAWIRIYYGTILMQTFHASVSFQVTARMFQDNSVLQKQLDSILYVFYFFSVGLFLYVIEIRFEFKPYGISGGYLYLFNVALLVVIFLAKVVLINAAGFFFNSINLYREYLYNILIFNKLSGISVLPLLLFLIYTNGILLGIFQWIAIVAVILMLGLRMIRGAVFSFKKDISIFYNFLYLCALELVPLALLYRWLEGIL